jgi:hypothetical protein
MKTESDSVYRRLRLVHPRLSFRFAGCVLGYVAIRFVEISADPLLPLDRVAYVLVGDIYDRNTAISLFDVTLSIK